MTITLQMKHNHLNMYVKVLQSLFDSRFDFPNRRFYSRAVLIFQAAGFPNRGFPNRRSPRPLAAQLRGLNRGMLCCVCVYMYILDGFPLVVLSLARLQWSRCPVACSFIFCASGLGWAHVKAECSQQKKYTVVRLVVVVILDSVRVSAWVGGKNWQGPCFKIINHQPPLHAAGRGPYLKKPSLPL